MLNPTFSLDFTTAVLDPSVTFTRAGTTATRVNSNGFIEAVAADTARFDFDPITLACKGLLIEEQRTNLMLQSENFATNWTRAGASLVTDDEQSPDGTINADTFTATSSTAVITQSITKAAAPITYTASLYMKGTSPSFAISLDDGATLNRGRISVNLTNGTFTTLQEGAFTILGADVVDAGNGWYRAYLSVTTNSTTILRFRNFFTVIGAEAILWGAQLEVGASATSYISTTTAAVTRNEDVAVITGANFSNFWQNGKGGVEVRAQPGTVSGTRPLVQFDDNTADNIIAVRGVDANVFLFIRDTSVDQANLNAGTIVENIYYNFRGLWQTDNCKAKLTSNPVVTDTTATIPTVTQARIGNDGTNYLNGHLATIEYYEQFTGKQIYTRRKNKVLFNFL
jgi:hypothetical protein